MPKLPMPPSEGEPDPIPVVAVEEFETLPKSNALKPVPVVDLEKVIAAPPKAQDESSVHFFFAELGVYPLPNGRSLHVNNHHMDLTDPDTIAHIDSLTKNHENRIFRQ